LQVYGATYQIMSEVGGGRGSVKVQIPKKSITSHEHETCEHEPIFFRPPSAVVGLRSL